MWGTNTSDGIPETLTGTRTANSLALALALGGGALCGLVTWAAHRGLIDDAFITLSYAKNLATEGHWGITLSQESNTATAPGNVLLLAGATALVSIGGEVRPVLGLAIVSVLSGVVLGLSLARAGRHAGLRWPILAAGGALVVLNPFVLSAIGLEVLPTAALLAALLATAVEGRPALFGVAAGAAVLLRLDLILFVLVICLGVPAIRARVLRVLPGLLLIGLPWYAWAWFHLGSAVPDTFVIKTLQRSFGDVNFVGGPLGMVADRPLMALVTFGPAVAGVLLTVGAALSRSKGTAPAVTLGFGGIAYFVVYANLHVPPYHWYFVPTIASLTLAGAFLVARWGAPSTEGRRAQIAGRTERRVALPAGILLGLALAASVGVAAGRGVPWQTPPEFGNWATADDYSRVASAVRARVGDAVVRNPEEIGQLAYFCNCAMVNDFTDRGLILPLIYQRYDQAGTLGRLILRINYHNIDRSRVPLPAKYELRYCSGPGAGPDTWQVWSPHKGVGHLSLRPVS